MIMKLKQNAKALDPLKNEKQVPIKERRFFFARSEDNGDVRPFWLAKVRQQVQRPHEPLVLDS